MSKIEDKENAIRARLNEIAGDGRISCSEAWEVAEELRVPRKAVGDACNDLGIKIHSCQLGCF